MSMNIPLEELRKKIDTIDDSLLELLAKRQEIVKEVGKVKLAHGIPLFDEKRKKEILEKKMAQAEALKLSKEFVGKLYDLIHDHFLDLQKKASSGK